MPHPTTTTPVEGRVVDDAVSRLPSGNVLADRRDLARRLVPHDDRRNSAAAAAVHPMYVASTDPARPDLQENIVFPDLRDRHVDEFEPTVLDKHQCFHA
jgi:hypothetical protein